MFFFKRRVRTIEGDIVDLRFRTRYPADKSTGESESVLYWICLHGDDGRIGECDLRIGMNDELLYAGNIGYRIYEPYRGHSYAYEAAKLLMKVAKEEYGMKELIITCSPDNPASKRTLEKLNGELTATVIVPEWHWLWRRGERIKHIFRYVL